MSQKSQNPHQSSPHNITINSEALNNLAATLQDAAQALLSLRWDEAPEPNSQAEMAEPEATKEAEQIRCYRVPGYIIQDEREALDLYKAEPTISQLTALPCRGSAKS